MTIIEPSDVNTTTPKVSVRNPTKYQRCIAFNAPLTRQLSLENFTHMIVDLDEETHTITFFPSRTQIREKDGARGYALMSDGAGGNSPSRAIFLKASVLTTKKVPSRRYDVTVGRNKFSITY